RGMPPGRDVRTAAIIRSACRPGGTGPCAGPCTRFDLTVAWLRRGAPRERTRRRARRRRAPTHIDASEFCLLIRVGGAVTVPLSFRAPHTLGRLSGRATVARRTRARGRARLDSRGPRGG